MASKTNFKSQKEEVLYRLQHRKSIKAYQFITERGIIRYGARIRELRNEGYDIEMDEKRVKKGNRSQRQTTYRLLSICYH